MDTLRRRSSPQVSKESYFPEVLILFQLRHYLVCLLHDYMDQPVLDEEDVVFLIFALLLFEDELVRKDCCFLQFLGQLNQ